MDTLREETSCAAYCIYMWQAKAEFHPAETVLLATHHPVRPGNYRDVYHGNGGAGRVLAP